MISEGTPRLSFWSRMGIKLPDLLESLCSRKNDDYSRPPSHQATLSTTLGCRTTSPWWCGCKTVGYAISGFRIYGFQTNLMVISKTAVNLRGDIPPFITSNLLSCLHDCRRLELCHNILCISLIKLGCAFWKCSIVPVIRPWVVSINTYSRITQKFQAYHYPFQSCLTLPMRNPSSTSPLSLSNSSDGSSNHHDNVPTSANSINLESYLCWMEFDLTIIANLIQCDPLTTQMPLNSAWGVMVVLKSTHMSLNFVLNFPEMDPSP